MVGPSIPYKRPFFVTTLRREEIQARVPAAAGTAPALHAAAARAPPERSSCRRPHPAINSQEDIQTIMSATKRTRRILPAVENALANGGGCGYESDEPPPPPAKRPAAPKAPPANNHHY